MTQNLATRPFRKFYQADLCYEMADAMLEERDK